MKNSLIPKNLKNKYTNLKKKYIAKAGTRFIDNIEISTNTISSIINEVKQLEIRKLTIYTPENKVIQSINSIQITDNNSLENEILARKILLKQIAENNTGIVIGNGGAGKIGLIQALAKKYNDENKNDNLYVIWRAAHSFENFNGLDFIDAAITYEPHVEARLFLKKEITEPKLLFLNHFEISSGKEDILNVKNYINGDGEWIGKETNILYLKHFMESTTNYDTDSLKNSPIHIMIYIILATFYKVYEQEHDEWHEFTKVYVSRYNHSAMGEKDETLFREALREIYYFLKDQVTKQNCNEVIKKIWEKLYLYDKPKPYENSSEWDHINFSKLYEAWMKHVQRETVKFPWEILKIAYDNNYYHLNDKAFYMESIMNNTINMNNILTSINLDDINNILINPGLLWSVSNKIKQGTIQHKFLSAITSNDYKEFIETWIPTNDNNESYKTYLLNWNNNKNNNNNLGIYSVYKKEDITFKDIYKKYTNHLFWRNTFNNDLEKRWNDWNPPQDLSQFIDIQKQRNEILAFYASRRV